MTRRFNTYFTCEHCGKRSTAESGFGRWMRNNSELDSGAGIVRTDTDHTILRYKTHDQGRDFQLIMDVEVKEHGSEPDQCQIDICNFKHQLAIKWLKNMHGSKTIYTHKLKSAMSGRLVRVRYFGFHLLQFEKTNPSDSTWIKWDRRVINTRQLISLLTFETHPYKLDKRLDTFLRDRHKQEPLLLSK